MSTPLRDLLNDLLVDPPTRAAFDADPERFLADHGWAELDGGDVHVALGAMVHELPVEHAALIAPLVAPDADPGQPGLAGAIAGLESAAAAVDAPDTGGDSDQDPAAIFDGSEATPAAGSQAADPADGIDAADPNDRRDGDELDADGDEDASDGPDLNFGEPATVAPIEEAGYPDGPTDDPGFGLDGESNAVADPTDHADPESLFGDDTGLPPHDPAEPVDPGDGDELDDGFPY